MTVTLRVSYAHRSSMEVELLWEGRAREPCMGALRWMRGVVGLRDGGMKVYQSVTASDEGFGTEMLMHVGETMVQERTYTVVLPEEDSKASTVVEEMDWGGLLNMVGGLGTWRKGVLVGVWKD